MTRERERERGNVKKSIMMFTFTAFLLCMMIYSVAQIEIINEDVILKESKFYPIWENKTAVIPTYKEIIPYTPYQCTDNKTFEEKVCINTTIEKVFDKIMTITTESKIIGYSDGNKNIMGFVYNDNGIIIKYDFNPRQRDYKNKARCRQYEIDKGVCHEY